MGNELNINQRLVLRMAELGMITRERADAACAEIADWKVPTDLKQQQVNLPGVLLVCGVAVYVHGEDVQDTEASYIDLVKEAAALSGGAVTVTDIGLVPDTDGDDDEPSDDDDDDTEYLKLRFKVDGELKEWPIEQESDEYLDMGAIRMYIGDLEPGGDDRRRFHLVHQSYDDMYLLATPEQAHTLKEEFEFEMDIFGD